MKFKLETAGYHYDDEQKEALEKLGFTFESRGGPVLSALASEGYQSKLTWRKISAEPKPTIEISSLEELMSFIERWREVVLNRDRLLIYDDYIE